MLAKNNMKKIKAQKKKTKKEREKKKSNLDAL